MKQLSSLVMGVAIASIALASSSGAMQQKGEAKEVKVKTPPAIEKVFRAAYPTAVIKGTSKETEDGQTVYEVESVDKGRPRDLLYKADGTVIEIEEEIDAKDVPAAVTAAIKARYPKATLTKSEKLTKGQTIQYEFQTKGIDVKEIVLAPDGTWVKPAAASGSSKR